MHRRTCESSGPCTMHADFRIDRDDCDCSTSDPDQGAYTLRFTHPTREPGGRSNHLDPAACRGARVGMLLWSRIMTPEEIRSIPFPITLGAASDHSRTLALVAIAREQAAHLAELNKNAERIAVAMEALVKIHTPPSAPLFRSDGNITVSFHD